MKCLHNVSALKENKCNDNSVNNVFISMKSTHKQFFEKTLVLWTQFLWTTSIVKSLTVREPHISFDRVTVRVSPVFASVTRGWLLTSTEIGTRLEGNGGKVTFSATTCPALGYCAMLMKLLRSHLLCQRGTRH